MVSRAKQKIAPLCAAPAGIGAPGVAGPQVTVPPLLSVLSPVQRQREATVFPITFPGPTAPAPCPGRRLQAHQAWEP